MAHILMVVEAKSFTKAPNQIQGTFEDLMDVWESRKYKFNGGRKGYCQPHYSGFQFMAPRIKEECISEHLEEVDAKILNPKKLDKYDLIAVLPKALSKIIFKENLESHRYVSVGTLFHHIRIWLHFLSKLPFVPLQSVDEMSQKDRRVVKTGWYYAYCFGYIKDKRNEFGEEGL